MKFEKKGKMGEESQRKKTTRVVESLGWLMELSIMQKKQRAIASVGPSSILELKAQLYWHVWMKGRGREREGSRVVLAKNKLILY